MRRSLRLLLPTAVLGLAPVVGAPVAAAPVATCESAFRCVVVDPRDDAFMGSAKTRRLTDLRRVRYLTPRTDDGPVAVRVAWPRLLDGAGGERSQELGVTMTARDGRFWSVVVDNAGDLEASELREGAHDTVRVPDPEEWSVDVVPGRPGRPGVLEVSFTTEWVPVSRARFGVWAETGHARDQVRRTPPLAVGG
ncbi:hypothetical protein [Nocardioides sp. CFH 31398]|uniref:hypothetical protein n=1 Tax=Nocardioides sp. CFH 31398 TaxID=2919579 RepID=UPI001F053ED5|nr:hypothetical protein [Nocardioides sp. CFH 31398]MCH1866193.1 hypothetical protein [Nocardioides sp. CFH 31398]